MPLAPLRFSAVGTAATSVLGKSPYTRCGSHDFGNGDNRAMIGAAGALTGILGGLGGTWLVHACRNCWLPR